MHRMTGYDAQFIYDESPNEPQHTIKLLILDAAASKAYSFERAKDSVRRRLPLVPPLSWRPVRIPFNLHHPVWVSSEEPNLDSHVRRAALPTPGGHRELCEAVSDIASTPLDPTRPLWEIWFLEGYEGDRVVTVLKISHALADGASTKELLECAFGDASGRIGTQEVNAIDTAAPHTLEPAPTRAGLIRTALRDLGRDLFVRIPRLVGQARRVKARSKDQGTRTPIPKGPSPFNAPRTAFSGPLSRRRTFEFLTVSLDDARAIKSQFDVTVNDVLLATVAGATRRYLSECDGGAPDGPMLGGLAASTRSEDQKGSFGNRLTSEFLWLPVHIEDPIQRIRAAHDSGREAKERIAERAGVHPESWIELLPPFFVRLISRVLRSVVRYVDPPGGVFISNVAGPRKPLAAGEGFIENFISVGHMKFIACLNVTVWSYSDKLNFALYSCAEAIPELWRVAAHIDDAFAELKQAAAEQAADAVANRAPHDAPLHAGEHRLAEAASASEPPPAPTSSRENATQEPDSPPSQSGAVAA